MSSAESESDDSPDESQDSDEIEIVGNDALGSDQSEQIDGDDYALGQSEIDDLFDICMDETHEPTGLEALINNANVRHKRLPTLEACFERLIRSLTNSMRRFTMGNVELSLADSTSIRFENYIDSVPLPTLISVYKAVEWNGYGLITIDSPLIYSIIDVLLGGSRASKPPAIEGRSFTKIEVMLIERMIKLILEEMAAAFNPLSEVHLQHERLESAPNRAMIAHPSDKAILFKIDVDMESRGGFLEILIPYATLEPLGGLLHQMFKGDNSARDSIWNAHLHDEALLVNTELEVLLGQQTVPLRTIMALEVGSTLELSSKPEDLMIIKCGDTPLMHGKGGRLGDKLAIKVDRWFSESERRDSWIMDAGEKSA